MDRTRIAVVALRIVLVLLFAGLLLLQTFSLPGQLAFEVEQNPEFANERWPLLLVLDAGLVCVQVVIVATWRLLTLVTEDRIFDERAFVWVDAIVCAVGVAWLLLVGLFFYAVGFGDPGLPILIIVMGLGTAVLGLLMVVMRALLRQATALRTDMEAVI